MNDKELEEIYNKNFTKIYRFFYYKVQSKEIAEDLTSESFIKFVSVLKSKTDIISPERYLFGIVKLVFLQYLRNKYKAIKSIPIEKEQDFGSYIDNFIEDIDEKKTPEEFAIEYINKLPKMQKIVLTLRLIDKLSLKEIADKLDKNMNYVKTTQKRGIKNLKLLISTFNVH